MVPTSLLRSRASLVAFIVACAGPVCAAPDGPVIWTLDDLERIGGHPVTRIGVPRLVETRLGSAVEFDGVRDGLVLDVNPIAGLRQFTVEVLFEPAADGPTEQRFIHISETGSDRRLMLETRMLPAASWCLDVFLLEERPGLALIDREKKHAAGAWHVAAATYDGQRLASYVDGVRELAGDVPFEPLGPGRIGIGVRQNLVSWFKGRIRQIRISPEAVPAEKLLRPPRP